MNEVKRFVREYRKTIPSATGDNTRQSGLISQQAITNTTAETTVSLTAAFFDTNLCRPAVRGFSLSISQSATRLKAMAAVRADTIARRIRMIIRRLGNPRAATIIDPAAKGRAKIVCEKRTNLRIRWMNSVTRHFAGTRRLYPRSHIAVPLGQTSRSPGLNLFESVVRFAPYGRPGVDLTASLSSTSCRTAARYRSVSLPLRHWAGGS